MTQTRHDRAPSFGNYGPLPLSEWSHFMGPKNVLPLLVLLASCSDTPAGIQRSAARASQYSADPVPMSGKCTIVFSGTPGASDASGTCQLTHLGNSQVVF